ncbi:MAG: type III-B CRISPR-associated protein Cas10/Cmr2 [Pseudonocardiaceae bacterium]
MAAQSPLRDLVVISLPGVQRLISEARSLADGRAGSEIVARLAEVAATSCRDQGGELVIPAEIGDPDGMPNRVVVLAPAGSGAPIAREATAAVQREWDRLLSTVLERSGAVTPGMPNARWVCVPDDGRGYGWQWAQAQTLLTARRRVRDFESQEWGGIRSARSARAGPPNGFRRPTSKITSGRR